MTTPYSRILLVDDEVSIQRAVGPLLRSRGYEVDVAATGAQALEMFAQRCAARFSSALTDAAARLTEMNNDGIADSSRRLTRAKAPASG